MLQNQRNEAEADLLEVVRLLMKNRTKDQR